jgi:cell division protein FtsI (penicillin-binding protein 3)
MQKSPSRLKFKNFRNAGLAKQRQTVKGELGGILQSNSNLIANSKVRLFTVWSILMVAGIGLAFNLYQLQIVRGPKLTEKARNQQMVNLRPYIPRRPVVDRNKDVLAIDRQVYTLHAYPKQFKKPVDEIATKLAAVLNLDSSELISKLNSGKSSVTVAATVPEEVYNRITALEIDGLELRQRYSRFYPQEDLVADVVGYVNLDRRGQAGVEYSQEKLLERSVQMVQLTKANNGALLPDYAPEGFSHSEDLRLQLTIDSRLQRAARTALKQQMNNYNAKRGAVIVMDAWDGSLLALVSQPTYNPNKYSKADISLFKNWTVADLYEPGSTFKPLNIAIALENNAIKPNDTFMDRGSIQVSDKIISNFDKKGNGRIDIAKILQNSSNIGMVQIIQRLQPSTYYGWLERLGLGQPASTDLPFEVTGQLKSQEEFISTPIEPATTSFGQGFSLTPLQLVQMHGALANGGKLVTPHVVRGLVDSKGQMHDSPTLPAPRQVFSLATTQKVVEMMETVVNSGSGQEAKVPGYRIAGKTGTAQKAHNSGGGYIKGARITSFVGILPVESPRYVVLAVVDEPRGENAYGGTVAAPIVKSVMEALITTEQIPPSQTKK